MEKLMREIPALAEALDAKYATRLEINDDLDRRMVSYQANKAEPVWRWLKFKEAFSAELVSYVLDRFCSPGNGYILDPFAGTGSAIFGASSRGCRGIGIEILPVAVFDMRAKIAALEIDVDEFSQVAKQVAKVDFRDHCPTYNPFNEVTITTNAFSPDNAAAICGYRRYCNTLDVPSPVRTLLHHACLAVLERCSYTRKDGQYLRWDGRAPGRRSQFCKGEIEQFDTALSKQLQVMQQDLRSLSHLWTRKGHRGDIDIIEGSCLLELPTMPDASAQLSMTSPPYCNRYDYTRTYALELVYLGHGADVIKGLRQRLVSCTVENKQKDELLATVYRERPDWIARAIEAFEDQDLLQTILAQLTEYRDAGELNNPHIVRMVRNYFYELSVVIHEVTRILETGGHFVMVNDNVQYAGISIPVDLILSDIAANAGLSTEHIWVLPRQKGNSSQQMAKYGRYGLRKSVYVWRKD